MNTNFLRILLVAFLSISAGTCVYAYSVDSGSGFRTSGCACLPPELEERGRVLEQSFAATKFDDLARQRWAGTLCENHPCEGEVSEELAKELLDSFFARNERRWDRLIAWLGVATGVAGILLAMIGLRQSARNERDIGKLQGENEKRGA